MSESKPTLLVTGASGHLGRRVVELLLESNTGALIAGTRTPDSLSDFGQRGVTIRHVDFDDLTSLPSSFAGVDRILIISTDKAGERLSGHINAVKAAEAAGVSHVIYTSLLNPDPDSPILLAPDHSGTEAAIAETKMGYTFLRNNIYADYQIPGLLNALKMGALYDARGNGKASFVTREDCARAAAAALTSPFTGRRSLDITGPEAVSSADLAAITSEITGQPLTHVPLTPDALTENMVNAGLPRPVADLLVSFDVAIAQDRSSTVSSAVEDLTGRKPIHFRDFLAANRSQFVAATS
jgi:NAD(P)H dehydrogenase (quinone)